MSSRNVILAAWTTEDKGLVSGRYYEFSIVIETKNDFSSQGLSSCQQCGTRDVTCRLSVAFQRPRVSPELRGPELVPSSRLESFVLAHAG